MKVGELLMLAVLAHGLWLHYLIMGQWHGSQPLPVSLILVMLSLFAGALIVYVFWHFLRYSELSTLFETDGFIQACSAFIFLDLGIATLKFTGSVPNFFFIQLVLVGVYVKLRTKIH